MTDLTPQREAEIAARADAATKGPWGIYESGSLIDIAADLQETGCGYRARREIARLEDEPLDNDPTHREWTAEEDWAQVQADAAFIAHAREDVDLLRAELAAVRAELAQMTAARNTIASLYRDADARLDSVLNICDREQRNATRWENPIPVPEWVAVVKKAALAPATPNPTAEEASS